MTKVVYCLFREYLVIIIIVVMSKKRNYITKMISNWTPILYGLLAVVTIPWTFYLALTLPTRHIAHHWDVAWVGLDTGLIIMLTATAIFAYRKSRWVVVAATATTTLLIVDAWFDVWTARSGKGFVSALVLALGVELPLAIITGTLAFRIVSHSSLRD
jgi:hypothetical protein